MDPYKIIPRHYHLCQKDPVDGVSFGMNEKNIFDWDFTIIGPKDSLYENGIFKGKIKFPKEYPLKPPKVIFTTPIYHPNVYDDGKVCISILLAPEDNSSYGYYREDEKWRPVYHPNSIMLSIVSLFITPNDESPANVDAGKDWRENRELFRKKVNKCVRDSLELADAETKS